MFTVQAGVLHISKEPCYFQAYPPLDSYQKTVYSILLVHKLLCLSGSTLLSYLIDQSVVDCDLHILEAILW